MALTLLNPNICVHIVDTYNVESSDYRTCGLSSSPHLLAVRICTVAGTEWTEVVNVFVELGTNGRSMFLVMFTVCNIYDNVKWSLF